MERFFLTITTWLSLLFLLMGFSSSGVFVVAAAAAVESEDATETMDSLDHHFNIDEDRDLQQQPLPDWSCENLNGQQELCWRRSGCFYNSDTTKCIGTLCQEQPSRDECTVFPIQQGCTWTENSSIRGGGTCTQTDWIVTSRCSSNRNETICGTVTGCYWQSGGCLSPCEFYDSAARQSKCRNQPGCDLASSRGGGDKCYQRGPIIITPSTPTFRPTPTTMPISTPSPPPPSPPPSSTTTTTPKEECDLCPNGFEYRFITEEATWYEHLEKARSQDCDLASIRSEEEQDAVERVMEPYIGFMYQNTDNFQGSFAYIGAQVAPYFSQPEEGKYLFIG